MIASSPMGRGPWAFKCITIRHTWQVCDVFFTSFSARSQLTRGFSFAEKRFLFVFLESCFTGTYVTVKVCYSETPFRNGCGLTLQQFFPYSIFNNLRQLPLVLISRQAVPELHVTTRGAK